MGLPILKILGGPVKGLVKAVGGVLDDLTTTDEERLKAKEKLLEIERSFTVKLAEIEADVARSQAKVIVAEATGKSWLQRNWRPVLMLFFAVIIGWVTWTGGYVNGRLIDPQFIMEILSIIKLGIGGYVIGRSAEKIAPGVVSVFKQDKKKDDVLE